MKKFQVKTFVSLEDVKFMCELDKKVFKENNQVEFKICEEWYNKNPRIYTAITDSDKLIGYINFMPITEDCYNRIKNGSLQENNVPVEDILRMEKNGSYYCLFSSVVIDKAYQNTEAFTILITTFYKNMLDHLNKNNIKIVSIIADCVNKKMEQFVINSGFKRVFKNKNSNIYEGNIFNK